jgi:SET family sugar efflux transporter-like MFS transporter
LIACLLALWVQERTLRTKPRPIRFTDLTLGKVTVWVRGALSNVLSRFAILSSGRVRDAPSRSEHAENLAGEIPRLPLAPLLISAFLWSLVTGAVYAVWANYMVSELGYSQTAMSALWSLASTSEFPLMVLAGWLSDRIGRLPMLCLGFVAWAIVFVGYVAVPVMPWIAVIQLIRGFAYSAYTATAMTYAAEVRSRRQRGQASGLYSSAGGLGSISGSFAGGTLAELAGFRSMIAVNAALILGGAVYVGIEAVRWARRARQPGRA